MKKELFIVISTLFFCIFLVLSGEADFRYMCASVISGNFVGTDGDIIFSKESGFYDNTFEVRLYAPTDEVYYTLDGSDPDKNSIRYEKPIRINDASLNANIYANRTDVTARFLEDELLEVCGNKIMKIDYAIPENLIDKCNIIKAVYYDKNGTRSAIEQKVYFVGFENKDGYDNVNIITITTDPSNLFDYDKGIYVLGRTFEEFFVNTFPEYGLKAYWNHWYANYNRRGREWERECNIQIFDTERRHVLSQNVGIRIQGGGSRGFLPKSLNLYAREEYGKKSLEYDFFGTGYYPKRITLSNGGDDCYTKIKDRLVSELAEDCNFSTMNYEPYAVFLNGEYWGFYYMTEKYDTNYVEEYYGVDKGSLSEDIIIVKNGDLESGEEEDFNEYYLSMLDEILSLNLEDDAQYERACELMDINSFIDYFAVEGYIARCGDWPNDNFALWRSKIVSEKPYEDGKWRWMLFDVNSTSLSEELISHDIIAALKENSELFNHFCDNEIFRKTFAERVIELSNTIFEVDYVDSKISEYIQLMDLPIEKHYQRFFGTSNEKYYEGIDDIKAFFSQRKPYVINSIKKHFGEQYIGEEQ